MRIAVGSYTGDGNSGHAISITDGSSAFQPDFVLVKDGANFGVATCAAMGANSTKQLTGAVAPGAGMITALTSTGFTLGTDARVNALGLAYYYIAIQVSAGYAYQSSYTGNGTNGHAVTGLGFKPDLIIFLLNTANAARWATSLSTTAGSQSFTLAYASSITSYDSDGFTLNSASALNQAGQTFYFIAFKFTTGLVNGLHYTGNGLAGHAISGAGFRPDLAFTQLELFAPAVGGYLATKDMTATNAFPLTNAGALINQITSLDADGFTVGNGSDSNTNTRNYNAMVFKAGSTDIAPTITAGPAVSYGSRTRTGPLNTPWHFSFTAHDDDTTGANALNWRVYTGAGRTGTLVASGTCTSDIGVSTTIAYNASGLVEGNQTLYLSVDDGTLTSADSSFTLKRDDTAPTDPTAVSHTPNPVLANALTFSITFTPVDALSTDAGELAYELRTASGRGGTLLDANVCTSGAATTTATVHDADLLNGFNALYLRITDGAGNVGEFVVSVLVEAATAATPDEIADALAGGDIVIYFTFEQRDNAFNFLADLSAAVSHASIDLDNDRAIVRLARFEVDPTELPDNFIANESNIAVNGVLDVNGIPTLFTLGLFRLDLSEEEFMPNDDSNWPSVDGADLTVILQSARFDEPYVIASGTNRIAAIRTLIESEGLEHDLPDDTGTLPIDAVGEPGSSKLDLINRILKDMNWFWLWSTEKGVQVSRERLNPEDEETAVIYSSVNEPRMVVSPFRRRNYRDQPNRVTVKIDDPLRTPAQATIENSDAQSSASTAKGPVRQTALSGATIADATMAQAIAEVEVREWAAKALGAELLTDFDPRRQPHETYQLHIDEVEVGTYWRVFGWTMDLATAAWGDPLMHHRIGRVLRLTTGVI